MSRAFLQEQKGRDRAYEKLKRRELPPRITVEIRGQIIYINRVDVGGYTVHGDYYSVRALRTKYYLVSGGGFRDTALTKKMAMKRAREIARKIIGV